MTAMPMGPRDVARITGVSTDTLRHYERKGLLPGVTRTAAGYRRYSADEPSDRSTGADRSLPRDILADVPSQDFVD